MRWITAGAVVLGLLAGCSSGEESPTSTSVPATTTTLPPSATTTTVPSRSVTSVDVCGLLSSADLETVLPDAGVGEPAPQDPPAPGEDPPALITGQCSWPSATDQRLSLSYLAPTTAESGSQHLEDVLATGTGFAEGGRVITQPAGAETVGILIDDQEIIREAAVVRRSALLYLVVDLEVGARDDSALGDYARLMVAALSRAPR